MKPDALIVIDVQRELVGEHPYQATQLLERILALQTACRAKGIPVMFVQHTEDEGPLVHGEPTWHIESEIAPLPAEWVFEKHERSAFYQTGLDARLKALGAKKLLLCGMQTEYCVDSTTKAGFELGYSITIPQGCTTTYDNAILKASDIILFYERYIWNGHLATVEPLEQVLDSIRR